MYLCSPVRQLWVSSWATQHSFFSFSSGIPSLPSQRGRRGWCHPILLGTEAWGWKRSNEFMRISSLLQVYFIESISKMSDVFIEFLLLLLSQYQEPSEHFEDKIGHHKPRASVACPCWSFNLKSRCKNALQKYRIKSNLSGLWTKGNDSTQAKPGPSSWYEDVP